MDKPLWLQRFEDPDGMTEKERKQYTQEASLREKQFADAQAFEEFIKRLFWTFRHQHFQHISRISISNILKCPKLKKRNMISM